MIFADKLIQLRKKAGWSQEELAEQLNVTRQSVSKWEGAQSIPDLEKIIRLSELFGVSTDYLLKEQIEEAGGDIPTDEASALRRVSMEEANAFLSLKAAASRPIALGVFLCILSPVCLFILAAVSEYSESVLSEYVASGIGMIVLLLLVAAAVAIFISVGRKTAAFEYLEKEAFETEYGVMEMVADRKAKYSKTYARNNILGAVLCILALIPFFGGMAYAPENYLLLVIMISLSFVLAGIGVVFFVSVGILWESYEKLLQEGDYTQAKKARRPAVSAFTVTYWLAATAIYLGYSFSTNNWGYSWIVWVIAGVMFPAILQIIDLFLSNAGSGT